MSVKHDPSGLGLDSIGDLSDLLSQPTSGSRGPMEIRLDLIDEDPNQPRQEGNPGFAAMSLEELAMTIQSRGVKSPISVRASADNPERYVINHGARRYRASRIAGLETIPAFIDSDYNKTDQVIENLQRDALTPREIAEFIGFEIGRGKKKVEIAKEIGKSPAFVTQHATLLDLPEPIARVFVAGRANDVTVINEICAVYKKHPAEVATWLADPELEITRGAVKLLREFISDKSKADDDGFEDDDGGGNEGEQETGAGRPANPANPDKLKKAILQVKHDGRLARLILNRRPSSGGWLWAKYEDDGEEFEAEAGKFKLVAIIEG